MVTKAQVTALTSVGVVAFSVGGTLGYLLGRRRGQVEEVIVERFVVPRMEFDSIPDHEDEIDNSRLVPDLSYLHETVEDAAPEESVVNILTIPDGDWDYEAELSTRTSDIPYVVHKDEFFNDEMDFKQSTVTYYKGDDILCDELEKPVYNYQHFIGPNLAFGHGSGDPNVFYVRNERERMEWEVLLDEGRYETEVLGLSIEHDYAEQDLKHSANRRFVMD